MSAKRPNSRDFEIYAAVRIHLRPQAGVALQFNLSQPRVSQFVKRVAEHMAEQLPGEDLNRLFAKAHRMELLDWECQERRLAQYRKCELVFEQSQQMWEEDQLTYEGPEESNNLVKTVVKRRPQRLSLEAVKEQRRLNNEIQSNCGLRIADCGMTRRGTAGGRGSVSQQMRRAAGTAGPLSREMASSGTPEKLPLPECLQETDRDEWNKLPREVQELATTRLQIWPDLTLHNASVPEGERWSYYPWRTEAEYASALLAGMVIKGHYTIEEYFQHLEHTELSKPLAHPNVLTKDREGRWTYIYPDQVPLPVMPPERAALPEESPERIYWPYKSKAEHYAMMRAEMVLRGHLSREQYESLNAWASWFMGEQYPDPLAKLEQNISAEGEGNAECGLRNAEFQAPLAGTKPGPGAAASDVDFVADAGPAREVALLAGTKPGAGAAASDSGPEDSPQPASTIANCELNNANCQLDSSICNDQFAMGNLQLSGTPRIHSTLAPALSHGEREATRLERRLASGRRMPAREQRRLAGRVTRQGSAAYELDSG